MSEPLWPQANLEGIHMPEAWDLPTPPAASTDPPAVPNGGRNVVYVCLIDNGVQLTHGELNHGAENFGWDVAGGVATNAPLGLAGEGAHATACAGIIGADWGAASGIGVVGIARHVRLHSVAVAQPTSGPNLVLAITEARTRALPNSGAGHRRVILLSGRLSIAVGDQAAVQTAIEAALADDIAVCVATGDTDVATLPFPATLPGIIVVGAVTAGAGALRVTGAATGPGTAPVGATWGSRYDATGQFVVAPGTAIKTTDITAANGYNTTAVNPNYIQTFSGTGAAATHAAGVAALLLSHNSRLTADDLRCLLYRTAEKISSYVFVADAAHPDGDWHDEVGYGRIHAEHAVTAARTSKVRVEVIAGGSGTTVSLPDVPYRRTQVATLRLHHDNDNLTSPVEYTLPALPANFLWAGAPGTIAVTAVAAGGVGHVDVTIEYTAPSATGSHGGTITITTDDAFTASVNVLLQANSVPPPIVHSVLVLDRSGSMAGTTADTGATRSEAVEDAARLFVDLLEDEDNIGIVRFDDRYRNPEDILLGMTLAGPIGSRAALRNSVTTGTPLAPDGYTTIAGGMILGMEVLDALASTSPTHRRAMIVMTDGHHNTPPAFSAALADINAATNGVPRVFAIGVGLDTIDSEFDDIVTVTSGYKYQTGPIVTDLLVRELFMKVLSNSADADFALDPELVAMPGQKQATEVVIGDTDFQVDFVLLFRREKARKHQPKIWLEAPDGAIVQAADILAGTVNNIRGALDRTHLVLRCLLPPFAAPRAHVGTWKVWLENTSPPDGNDQKGLNLAYSVMAMVKSDLKLRGHISHPDRKVGKPFKIVAEPTLYGAPVVLAHDPDARVKRPDGVVRLVPLTRDTNGAYTGEMTDTGLVGVYTVDIDATAVSPAGLKLNRYLQLQTMVGSSDGTITSTTDTPEGGTGTGTGGSRPGCLVAVWCGFWRFWGRLFCCGCGRQRR
ncbi:MAG TPA: S8 family serine peptidase [Polyangiaceae bacterium]|nr:S8 family serine peptidase [Polyangiaceae bacterium]